MDCKYFSRVLLKGGTGKRGKTVCVLMPPEVVDVSRFRIGGTKLTPFFVVDERLRSSISFPSYGKEG